MTEKLRCPFCQKGTMKLNTHPLFVYYHKRRMGYWRRKLQAFECDGCGIVVFKRVEDQEKR